MEEGEENGSRLLRLKGHFHFLPTSQGIKSVAPAALLCVCVVRALGGTVSGTV